MKLASIFCFPDTPGLRTRWWHRLVLVAMLLWAAVLAFAFLRMLIIAPYQGCLRVKFNPYSDGSLDCGTGMIGYTISMLAQSSLEEIMFGTAFIAAFAYAAIAAPALAYRVVLYIATGGGWKKVGCTHEQ